MLSYHCHIVGPASWKKTQFYRARHTSLDNCYIYPTEINAYGMSLRVHGENETFIIYSGHNEACSSRW